MDALHVGLRLHALYTDGEYYPAEVVEVSRSLRRWSRPVKVKFAGYGNTAWCAVSELRSKVFRASRPVQAEVTLPRRRQSRAHGQRGRRDSAPPPVAREISGHAVWTPQTECGVCFDRAKPTDVTMCGHFFCDPCLQRWRRDGQNSCPACRQPLEGSWRTMVPGWERQARMMQEQERASRAAREGERELSLDDGLDIHFRRSHEQLAEQLRAESARRERQERERQASRRQDVEQQERERWGRERAAMALHAREPSPDDWLFESDHLDSLRDEYPDLSDDALEDIYDDRMQADAEEFGGYCSDSS